MLIAVSIKPLHKGKRLCSLPMTKCTAAHSLPLSGNQQFRAFMESDGTLRPWSVLGDLISRTCLLSLSVVSSSFWPPQTLALQTPLSMGVSRQEYWSGLSFPPPGDLPNPGIKPESPELQADSLPLHRTLSLKVISETFLNFVFCFLCSVTFPFFFSSEICSNAQQN